MLLNKEPPKSFAIFVMSSYGDLLMTDTLIKYIKYLNINNKITLIVEDRNGCKDTSLSVEITEPSAELTVLVDSDNETCLSNSPGENGIIRVTPQGGSQLFKYFIDSVAVGSFTNFSPNAFISEDTIANG